jgi:two-component system, OmpR family, sensor histidine kinase KdpD
VLYTPKGTEIIIDAVSSEEKFEIIISDNGPGISAEAINNIFDKFYRVNKSTPGGIGLGLSIAKGFIESHNGKIAAENLEPHGTKFTVSIPVYEIKNSSELPE